MMDTLAPLGLPDACRAAEQADRDALLQLSRRVDWRFLLPQPTLTDVAVIGMADPELREALRHFSTSVSILDLTTQGAETPARFSVVVARNPTELELQRAMEATSSGGFLYVEVGRQTAPGRLRGVRRYRNALRKLGVIDVAAHWHWPAVDACHEIIPLGDRGALVGALRRRGTGIHSRIKAGAARLLLECGLLAMWVTDFSLLGRRP